MPAFFLSQRLYEGRTVCTALIFIPPQAVRPFRKRGDFSLFIWDFVASTVMDNLIDWFYGQIVGFLGNFFSAMGNMGVEIFELEWVQAIVLFFSQLGWALYGVSLVVCAFEFGIGDVGQQIITDLGSVESIADMTQVTLDFGFGVITSPIMLLFCIILMAYAVIKVFFANLKRGGILLIQIAVGSLYMFSIPRGYVDGFVQWMKQVIGLCLTAFLQSTILVAGLMVFKDHALLGLGLMLSAGEVPRIAGTFGLDTTTRANIMSAVYTAQAAVNTTRTIAAAVAPK